MYSSRDIRLRWLDPAEGQGAARSRWGFTLIEVLVVIAVVALLAALVGPSWHAWSSSGDQRVARTDMEAIALALEDFRAHTGAFPSTEQGLEALRVRPRSGAGLGARWRGPYLSTTRGTDPWGRPYRYAFPSSVAPLRYELLSYGRDGELGGSGPDADIIHSRAESEG